MKNDYYHAKDKTEFFPTPEFVKAWLYDLLPKDTKTILDPCCGNGGLDFVPGYDYTLFDIKDYGVGAKICNFLEQKPTQKYDCVVLNPPFGEMDAFIEKAFEFSDDILLVAPIRKFYKSKYFSKTIDYTLNWRISFIGFGVLVSIGLFHLNKRMFSSINLDVDKLNAADTFMYHFRHATEAPNKWFIVNRLTKARVLRNEQLIKDSDIYAPNDNSAFIAQSSSIHTKVGDKVERLILEFDSKEEAIEFQQLYIKNQEVVRDYVYRYGAAVLHANTIPFLQKDT